MAPRPPFDMLRAAFWLLAIIIVVQTCWTIVSAAGCFYLNLAGPKEIGACMPVTTVIREQWAEMLSAVLALLLAARSGPPSQPPE